MKSQMADRLSLDSSRSENEEYFALNTSNPTISTRRGAPNLDKSEDPSRDLTGQLDTNHVLLDDLHFNSGSARAPDNTPITSYLSAFFMTIATVLGTGILGLPVKLSKSGFTPLLATYTLVFIMQSFLVVFMAEILQRARVEFQKRSLAHTGPATEEDDIPLVSLHHNNNEDIEELEVVDVSYGEMREDPYVENREDPYMEREGKEDEGLRRSVSSPASIKHQLVSHSKGEDLHSLAKAYLNSKCQYIFDGAIILHFLSLLITYTLASSEAYGQLFGLDHGAGWIWLAVPFVIIFSCLVIFTSKLLEPIISIFTFAKAGLLVLMVIITAVAGASVKQEISDDWKYIGRPFLIGTVALGGCFNILPVAFSNVKFHPRQIKIWTCCALAGVTLVFVFNLVWCYFVLRVVPQTITPGTPDHDILSLAAAEKNGQISTVPLVNIINRKHPKYAWIATIVMLFTIVSITVSFVVNSIGWKHYLDGLLTSWTSTRQTPTTTFQKVVVKIRNIPPVWKHAISYTVSFAFVLIFALSNPKSFLKIMEKVTSMAANGTAALMCWVLHNSRLITPSVIPWTLPPFIFKAHWFVLGFFVSAMLYNVVATITEFAGVTWL